MSTFLWFLYVAGLFGLCCVSESLATATVRTSTESANGRFLTVPKTKAEGYKKEFFKVNVHWMECTKRKQGKLRYDIERGTLLLCYDTKWRPLGWKTSTPAKGRLPLSCLDAKLKGLDRNKGNGLYWINPSGVEDLRNSMLVYCDMTTAGGGWALVAKITNDYAWICPEKKGYHCLNSTVDPLKANLFHSFHAREFVDLSITADENSGIHLKNSIIRRMFMSGHQSIRVSFVTSAGGWTPSEDAYAAFNTQKPNKMFLEKTWANYTRENGDYTWNVIRHDRISLKFSGSVLCWGMGGFNYRHYDNGLHIGSPTKGEKRCHMQHNDNEVMLKSHYARMGIAGIRKVRWDVAQFGYLRTNIVQAPCKRIALWVR